MSLHRHDESQVGIKCIVHCIYDMHTMSIMVHTWLFVGERGLLHTNVPLNIQHKSPEIACNPQSLLYLVSVDIGIVFLKTPSWFGSSQWDELGTNLRGVKFLCWMDERCTHMQ